MQRWKKIFVFGNRRQQVFAPQFFLFVIGCLLATVSFGGCQNEIAVPGNPAPDHPSAKSGERISKDEASPGTRQSVQGSHQQQHSHLPTTLELDSQTTEIELGKTISDSDFAKICQLKQLETLILDGGGVRANQVGQLAKLTHLEHLRIRNCHIDDAGIAQLTTLRKLRIVNFPQAEFTDNALKKLVTLPNLQLLRFSSPQVTDHGLAFLKTSMTLRALHLIRVNATDHAVEDLCRIKTLESLYLDGAKITDDGFSKILKLRPDVHLHVDQVHLDYDPNKHEHTPK